MPKLDPHLQKVLTWDGDRKDFPAGPMYWVEHGKLEGEGNGEKIKAYAVGTEGGKERKEDVCVVTKVLPPTAEETASKAIPEPASTANGHLAPPGGVLTAEHLTAPTETDLPSTITQDAPSESQAPVPKAEPTEEKKEVQDGELVPPSRPQPQTFVTATEGLTLSEKERPHETETANRLDPNLHVGKEAA